MSAIHIRGKVVTMSTVKGKSKKTGEPYEIITYYVVNGNGPPVALNPSRGTTFKRDQEIDVPVYTTVFNGNVQYNQINQG